MLQSLSLFVGRAFTFRLEDLRREAGQTTLEYAVITALVVVLAVGAMAVFTPVVTNAITAIGTYITTKVFT